jgi:molecular chaperone GrpE
MQERDEDMEKANTIDSEQKESGVESRGEELSEDSDKTAGREQEESTESLKKKIEELNDKYIRLYADFENYKKTAARNREELLKYANEGLMSDILTVIDHLELALQHSSENESANADALAKGVDLTLKELRNVLEKHGLTAIESLGKPFDPNVHHAISQIESDEAEENTVLKEFRKGYMLRDRVLRAAMVGVAKKPSGADTDEPADDSEEKNTESEDSR